MGGGRGTEVVLKSRHHHPLEFFALISMVLMGVFFFCDLGSTWGYADVFC